MADQSKRAQDRIVGILMMLVGVVMYYETYSFKTVEWDWMGLPFWPRLVISFLCALGLYFTVRGSVDNGPYRDMQHKAFYVLAGVVVYVALIEPIGYAIVTPIFIGLYSWSLSPKTKRAAIEAVVVGIVGTLIIFYIFKEALYVQFPEGLLEEKL